MTNQFSPKVSEILSFSREEAAQLASSSVGRNIFIGNNSARKAVLSMIYSVD